MPDKFRMADVCSQCGSMEIEVTEDSPPKVLCMECGYEVTTEVELEIKEEVKDMGMVDLDESGDVPCSQKCDWCKDHEEYCQNYEVEVAKLNKQIDAMASELELRHKELGKRGDALAALRATLHGLSEEITRLKRENEQLADELSAKKKKTGTDKGK